MSFVAWALRVELTHLCWRGKVHRSQLWMSPFKRKRGKGLALDSRLKQSSLCCCQGKGTMWNVRACDMQRLFLCLNVRGNKEEQFLGKNQGG